MAKKLTAEREAELLGRLKEAVQAGDTVFTILRSVSKSGMSRKIDLVVIKDGRPLYLTSNCADLGVAGMSMSTKDWSQGNGAKINGCGMDMGFHAVYCLSQRLFGDGYTLKQQWL